MASKTVYDFTLNDYSGNEIDFNTYRNKPLIIVNTASHCKFTPQYEGLEDLWLAYRRWGLTIIAVPSGDFGEQEFKTNEEIKDFCRHNYNISFILAQKSHVKGKYSIPLFQWLAAEGGMFSAPRWNFYKYLINRQGRLNTWFSSITPPSSKRFIKAVERISYGA